MNRYMTAKNQQAEKRYSTQRRSYPDTQDSTSYQPTAERPQTTMSANVIRYASRLTATCKHSNQNN
jgi:hypothetical protein